jgi:ABC-type tungstate transport system substrate-binding protein
VPANAVIPAPLRVAAALTALEAVALVVLSIVQIVNFSSDRVAMNLTTIAFFLIVAAGLAIFARAILLGQSWARSPIVLAQLIQLGVAWSFVQADADGLDKTVAWFLAALAIAVLVGMFHPKSLSYLAGEG